MRDERTDAARHLAWSAAAAVVTHLIAGLAMALILRQGLESNTNLPSRLQFLVERRLAWTMAWITWNIAALSIAILFVTFHRFHKRFVENRGLLNIALVVGCVAVIPDLSAEVIEMTRVPTLAVNALPESREALPIWQVGGATQRFLAAHDIAMILTGAIANGLYTAATVLNTLASRSVHPRWVTICGLIVGVVGSLASVASLMRSIFWLIATNAILVPAILAWLCGVGLTANRLRTAKG